MTAQRSPAMQFYFRQFSGDEHVQVMDLEAVGAHILLMCYAGASENGFKIPFDRKKIAKLLRSPSDEKLEQILAQLLDGAWKVSDCGGWIEQHGMQRTLRKQKKFSKLQSDRARRRWSDTEKMPDESRKDAAPQCSSSASASASTNNIYNNKRSKRVRLKISQDDVGDPPTDENSSLPTQLQELFKSQGKTEVHPNIWVKQDWFDRFKAEPRFKNYIDAALNSMHQWSIGLDVSSKTKLPHWVSYRMKRDHQRVLIDQILRIKEKDRAYDEARA